MKIQITIILMNILMFSLSYGHQNEDDYVDPTDLLNFDPVNVRMKMSTKSSDAQNVHVEPSLTEEQIPIESNSLQPDSCSNNKDAATFQDCPNIRHSLESFTSLFRQYVNTLVHTLDPKVGKASNPVEINLRLRVSYHDISKLRTFGEGGAYEIHDVHETLSSMIQYSSDVLQPESHIYWLERKIGISFEYLMQILVIVFFILMSLTMLPRIHVSKSMLTRALFFIFIVSVIFNWIEMYQKEVADQEKILMTHRLSDHCPKMEELSVWGRLTTYISSTFTFQNEKCREYYQAMLVNPFVKVSPLEAVSVAIVKTVFTPLEIIGTGIRKFIISLLIDLPVQYQLIVIIVVSTVVVLMLFFRYHYKLNILGLISLGPSETHHNFQGAAITNQLVHDNNRVTYQMQEPICLQSNRLDSHVAVIGSPQDPTHVPTRRIHEGCCNSNSSKPGSEKGVTNLNDSNTVRNINRHKPISLNNTNQTNAPEHDQIVHSENVNFAVGASLTEEHLKNSKQQDASDNANTDQSPEYLSKQIKDLTIADITPQEEEAEIHLSDTLKSVSISAEIDPKVDNKEMWN